MSDDWSPRTQLVHDGTRRSQYGEISEAIFLTQGFVYPIRPRRPRRASSRPARTSSSMRATATRPCGCSRSGSRRSRAPRTPSPRHRAWRRCTARCSRSCRPATTSCRRARCSGRCLYIVETLLPRFGVEVSFVDGTDLDQWRGGDPRRTPRLVFLEIDLEPDARGHRHRRRSPSSRMPSARRSSSTTSSPRRSSSAPRSLGADVVIYSATKHIDGQGRCLGGVVARDAGLHPRDVLEPSSSTPAAR